MNNRHVFNLQEYLSDEFEDSCDGCLCMITTPQTLDSPFDSYCAKDGASCNWKETSEDSGVWYRTDYEDGSY